MAETFDFTDPGIRQAYKNVFASENGFDLNDPDVNALLDKHLDALIPPQPEKGGISETVDQGIAGFAIEVPRMVGKALQYTGQPGDTLHDAGKRLVDRVDTAERQNQWLKPTVTEESGPVKKAFSEGARMVGPSIAIPAALGLGLSAAPVSATTATLVASGLGVVPMALAQGQSTIDKAQAAGVPYDEAVKAARGTALIEGAGEAVAGYAGLKFIGMGGRLLSKFGSASAAEKATNAILKEISDTRFTPRFLKSLGQTLAAEIGTEVAQSSGQAAIERAYDIDNVSPYDAGKSVIGPTAAMTMLLAPFGANASYRQAAHNTTINKLLNDPAADPEQRVAAARIVHDQLKAVDQEAAMNWAANSTIAIAGDQPLSLDRKYLAKPEAAIFGFEENKKPAGPLSKAAAKAPAAVGIKPAGNTEAHAAPAAGASAQDQVPEWAGGGTIEPGGYLPPDHVSESISKKVESLATKLPKDDKIESIPVSDVVPSPKAAPPVEQPGLLDQLYTSKKKAQAVINQAIKGKVVKPREYEVVADMEQGGWVIKPTQKTETPKPNKQTKQSKIEPSPAEQQEMVKVDVGPIVDDPFAIDKEPPGYSQRDWDAFEKESSDYLHAKNAKKQEIETKAHEAATSSANDIPQPTEAMKKAGNYRSGKAVSVNESSSGEAAEISPVIAKEWFIDVNDKPVFTDMRNATYSGMRGPYTKIEAAELTGTHDLDMEDFKRWVKDPAQTAKKPGVKAVAASATEAATPAEAALAKELETAPDNAGDTVNPKVSRLVAALQIAGHKTTMSGDMYGDNLVYVDLDEEAAANIDTSKLPAGWKLTYADTTLTERDVLGKDIPAQKADVTNTILSSDKPVRLSRAGKEPVSEKEIAAIVASAEVAGEGGTGKTVRQEESAHIGPAGLVIKPLSEKAILVVGDTAAHKDRLNKNGLRGLWMGKHKGWMFPKKREAEVREKLADLLGREYNTAEDIVAKAEDLAKKYSKEGRSKQDFIDNAAFDLGWAYKGSNDVEHQTKRSGSIVSAFEQAGYKRPGNFDEIWEMANGDNVEQSQTNANIAGPKGESESNKSTVKPEVEEYTSSNESGKTPVVKAKTIEAELSSISMEELDGLFDAAEGKKPEPIQLTDKEAREGRRLERAKKAAMARGDGDAVDILDEKMEDRARRINARREQSQPAKEDEPVTLVIKSLQTGEEEKLVVPAASGKKAENSNAGNQRSAADIAYRAAKAGAEGVGEAVSGLYELFGGASLKSFPGGIDKDTYLKAKPHFESALEKFKEAGKSLAEFVQFLVDNFGAKIRPYAKAWVEEKQGKWSIDNDAGDADNIIKEAANEPDTDAEHGEKALDAVLPEEGQGTKGGREVRSGSAPDGVTGAEEEGTTDQGRVPRLRGGRSNRARNSAGESGRGRGRRSGKLTKAAPEHPAEAPAAIPGVNFVITDELRLGIGGEAEKFNDNLAAIRTLKNIEAENRRATAGEQRILARYVGWGGLANAFRNLETKEFAKGWEKRGSELEGLLSGDELGAARSSTRNAHYTSETVVRSMWKAAEQLGFRGGLILESSAGTGNFLGTIPDAMAGASKFFAVEQDSITARIAKHLYPQSTVIHSSFAKLPIPENAFDLAIGNPPFGRERLRFQFNAALNQSSIHNQFFRANMDALKPGGLQIMVVSRFFMDAQDSTNRQELAIDAELLGAIRLPDTAFAENARTEVVTDIVLLRKRTPEESNLVRDAIYKVPKGESSYDRISRENLIPAWVKTATVQDAAGGEPIVVNSYFQKNPSMMLGSLERTGSMRQAGDVTLRQTGDLQEALDKALANLPTVPADEITAERTKATEDRFSRLSESMQIFVDGHEVGGLSMRDGKLIRTIEVDTPEGGQEMRLQTITADSPWSSSLYLNKDGKWSMQVDVKDAAGKKLKKGRLVVRDEKVYESEADIPAHLKIGESRFSRLKQLISIRDLRVKQMQLELSKEATAQEIEGNRTKLRTEYRDFVKSHGFINDQRNAAVISEMPDEALVTSLEIDYRKEITQARAKANGIKAVPASAKEAAILHERTQFPYEPPSSASSPADALAITLSEYGRVDINRLAGLLGADPSLAAEVVNAGQEQPLIFMNPETKAWETADTYLSGNVARKLQAARDAGIAENIAALEGIQPEEWGSDAVTAIIGSTWIPTTDYEAFISSLTEQQVKISFSEATNSFALVPVADTGNKAKMMEWGTDRRSAVKLVDDLLNSRQIKVTYVDDDGKTHVDHDATKIALLRAEAIRRQFREWIFDDADRRRRLTKIFNDKFNTRITRQHDGSHLKLPGKVPDDIVRLRRGQINAIWRGISERFVLLDHVVGAGKTYVAIARAMERRRMGLSRKPMMVVPNHLTQQFAADILRLYPGAKVLAADKKDFARKNRRRLFAKIAAGDWDTVVIGHSALSKIAVSKETEERFLRDELLLAMQAIEDAQEQAEADGTAGRRFKPHNVKEAEALATRIQTRLDSLKSKKVDRLMTFEQLGVDDITIDEAHEFKNLFYSSRLTGVKGMGTKIGSQKAADLYIKLKVLRENPASSIVFMTGTPISNSAVEMYNIMRHLAADDLRDLGLEHFDAWRAQFVEVGTRFEANAAGDLKEVNRLGKTWSNAKSLMELYYSFADVVTQDDLKQWHLEDTGGKEFPVPKVKGGGRNAVVVKPSPAQMRILMEVISDYRGLQGITDIKERNAERLRLMDRARKVSLDARAVDPRMDTQEEGGKLEVAADNITRLYKAWDQDNGTQLVFLDRSVEKAKGDDKIIKEFDELRAKFEQAIQAGDQDEAMSMQDRLDKFDRNEIEELRAAQSGGWNAYRQLKQNLIDRGIPANEIKFIQEANTDQQKQELFDAVNDGRIRVLIGSTPKMGAGTNVQERLVGLHHLDVTWKPSDIEQREGRIIRQGNKLLEKYGDKFEVEIMAYVTEKTVDQSMWDLNASKMSMINKVRKYDGSFTMDFSDEESISMAEIAAAASGDKNLLRRVELQREIDNLEILVRDRRKKNNRASDTIEMLNNRLAGLASRTEQWIADNAIAVPWHERTMKASEGRSVTINGDKITDRTEANKTVFDEYAKYELEAKAAKEDKTAKKPKFSITIDGEIYHSKDKAVDAVAAEFGDGMPFLAVVGESEHRSRTETAREIMAVLQDHSSQGDKGRFDIGELFGRKLAGRYLGPQRFSFSDEKVAPTWELLTVDKDGVVDEIGTVVDAAGIRKVLGATEKEYSYALRGGPEQYRKEEAADRKQYQQEMEAARKLLDKPFPEKEQLDKMVDEFEALTRQIAGSGNAEFLEDGPGDAVVEQVNDGSDVKYSRATKSTNTVEAVTAAISGSNRVSKLLADGRIKVVQRAGEMPSGSLESGIGGAFDPAGDTIYLVSDGIKQGQEERVLEHEAFHRAVAKGQIQPILDELARYEKMAGTKGAVAEWFAKARESSQVDKGTPHYIEEIGAYAVQNYEQSPNIIKRWVDKLIAKVRASIFQIFGVMPKNLDPAFLREIALSGLKSATVKGNLTVGKPLYSQIKAAKAIYSKLKQVASDTFTGMKAQGVLNFLNKQGVKKAEIEATGLDAWLKSKNGNEKVTKSDLMDFVRANSVETEDVVLGGGKISPREWAKRNGYFVTFDRESGGYVITDRNGKFHRDWEGEIIVSKTEDKAFAALEDYMPDDAETSDAPFSKYTGPGAEEGSYREMFVTAPDVSKSPLQKFQDKIAAKYGADRRYDFGAFTDVEQDQYTAAAGITDGTASGWQDGHSEYSDIQNPIVRVRFNTRTDAEGRKLLFIEEMQGPSKSNQDKMPKYLRGNIYQIGVKRVLAYAKEKGFDGVSWTTGEMQADRYDLSKQVDKITWSGAGPDRLWSAHRGGRVVMSGNMRDAESSLGKEIAKKIADGYGSSGRLVGLDLRVGGEGLKRLYDVDLPAMFKAYGNGEVGEIYSGGFKSPFIPITGNTPSSYPLFSRQQAADNASSSFDTDMQEVAEGLISSKQYRPDTGGAVWSSVLRMFSSPEHYFRKVPALKRYFDAVLKKDTIKHEYQNAILGNNTKTDVIKTLDSLRKSDRSQYDKLAAILKWSDQHQQGYTIRQDNEREDTWKVVDPAGKDVDGNSGLTEKEAVEVMLTLGAEYVREKGGLSDDGVKAWMTVRLALNRGFDIMADQMRRIIQEARETKQETPAVDIETKPKHWALRDENKKVAIALFETEQEAALALQDMQRYKQVTQSLHVVRRSQEEIAKDPKTEKVPLSVMLAMMGELRGTYMPRLREPGAAVLIARKEGANPIRENFDLHRTRRVGDRVEVVALPGTPMSKRANELKAKGYHVVLQKDESMSEDVFSAAKLVAATEAILDAGEKNAKGDDRDSAYDAALVGIHNALNLSIANIFKGRGFRGSMIARNQAIGGNVWEGYEQDPLKAVTQYAKNISGGIAKRDTARDMVLAITGRDISWSKFKQERGDDATWDDYVSMVRDRRVDPQTQKNAYHDVMRHMEEFLRNEELEDRIVGVLKGLAALKYMGFRVSSAAVNLTNLAMAVPATMTGIGNIPYAKTWGHIQRAAVKYGLHRLGKGSESDKSVFDEIHRLGWDDAQFNMEAARVLQSKLGQGWDRFMSLAMAMFGATERVNRATTIFAAYQGIREHNKDMGHDAAMELAKDVSDKAHGIYGKATLPYMVQGKGPGQMAMRSAYTFAKFSHNYLLTMLDLGFNKRDYLAASHMLLAPMAMAGVGSSVLTPLAVAIMKGLGLGGDDPEEELYAWADESFGGGDWLRGGLLGLGGRGVNLEGSIGINLLNFPTTLKELLGAPVSVLTDGFDAIVYASKGHGLKAAEKALPAGIGNMIRAYRESTEGVTTRTGAPVFHGMAPLMNTKTDAVLRFLSFNPSRMAKIKDVQWSEKQVAAAYSERRRDIYDRYRAFLRKRNRTPQELAELVRMVSDYNTRVRESGRLDLPFITGKSVLMNMRRSFKPSKAEQIRAVKENMLR